MKTAKPKKPPIVYPPLPYGTNLLSLDVSSAVTGWAVGRIAEGRTLEIKEFGYMKPPSGWDFERRINEMIAGIDSVVRNYQVTRVVMEFQSHKRTRFSVQGLAVLGQAQGSVWRHLYSLKPDRVSERDWVRVNGKMASKETRREHIKATVPEYAARSLADPKYDPGADAADALGLLIFRANQGIQSRSDQ
jgi:Holliday junction resolvasome RuvABC endonuclease subunit